MEDLDIIEERDGYRVRLQLDDTADKPYDDGGLPTLTVETNRYGGYRVEAFNNQADDYVDIAAEILARHGMETLERFFKIFRGALKVETYWSTGIEGNYVAFDTAEWREKMGVTGEILVKEDYLFEVKAWAEGDVYGWIVEKELSFEKKFFDAEGEDAGEETGTEWTEVDSCWGFYGREYAEDAAKEALKTATENLG